MKHFVTLFPEAQNIHLIKDVGQIPYQMAKLFNYDATLVCYKNGSYSYLKDQVRGLNITFLEDTGKTFYWENAVCKFIYKKAATIDVLNLYHLNRATVLYGMIYKLLNPKGVLYLKLDMNGNKHTKSDLFQFSEHFLRGKIHRVLLSLFMKKADIISVETQRVKEKVQPFFNTYDKELLYLPNGLDPFFLRKVKETKTVKENIILTVGRIGSPIKNHAQLLDALAGINLRRWNVYFIGPVEASFQSKVDAFYNDNPGLKDTVHFTGNITDRKRLFNFYKRSKIFCLPSLSENFPFSMLEAMSEGNYVIAADTVAAINELSNDGEFGHIIPLNDTQALQQALKEVTAKSFFQEDSPRKIMAHIEKNYSWHKIIGALDQAVKKADS